MTISPADVARRRAYVRERIWSSLGGMPARTPLNARVTGVLERDGYRIEKILFESQPRFYVTANLYVPKSGAPPYSTVLFPLGHERGAKSHDAWQQILVTLARRGYLCLAWDTLGQGERIQFWDADAGESRLGRNRSTSEHSMLGAQTLLVGESVARYTVWDGIRALDYLLGRPEADATRVAVTGNSGGGTHSAYLAALDDRIQVVVPSCYLTTWRHLLETIGPQDAEQCMPPFLADGLDHGDFVLAAAPKPYLILSAIRDFFAIGGARQTYREAQGIYRLFDAESKVHMVEADDGHGYSAPRRDAAYRWLSRWLKGAEDATPETPVAPETEETLFVTESGQVASLGGETVHSLNLARARERIARRAPLDLASVPRLIGYQPAATPPRVTPYGTVRREGYRIEKGTFENEPGVLIPGLLFTPDSRSARGPATVFVHGRGKSAGAGRGGEIERLVKAGHVVLALDTRGSGELRQTEPPDGQRYSGYFGDYDNSLKAMLMGKTLVGLRAADVNLAVELLAASPNVDPAQIHGYGVGAGAIVLLHAAACDPRLRGLTIDSMLVSYQAAVETRVHREVYESLIPGVLARYDLPELAAALAPRGLLVINPADPAGNRLSPSAARQAYAAALQAGARLELR
ncbi:MAG: acetylxylan esterase [Acidobacteria bacterium]|nr:acetylxylan esterase [Acidobacteriota bacterium]